MLDWVSQFVLQFGDAVFADDGTFAAQSVQGVVPSCLCSPESESQAAAIIRFAVAHKVAVVPCGGGTSQERCAPPAAGFLALSTKRLNKLVHHEPGDMVATVQAGMTLGEFQTAIRAGGQWLPIDAPDNATIGGIVAANAHGPRALGYGTLRDMILGMTVVNGDGAARKCGGKVVKNVTGYALDKLYIGSFGTLGVVTEVTFKLRPLSIGRRFWGVRCPTMQMGLNAMRAIAAKNLPLEMLRLCNPDEGGTPRLSLYALASGTESELKRIGGELELLREWDLGLPGDLGRDSLINDIRGLSYGKSDYEVFEIGRKRGATGATLRFGCVSSALDATQNVLGNCDNFSLSIGMNGGIIDLSPLSDSEAARIASEFEKLGVNFAFENIVGVNIPNRWGTPRPEWAIMKQIKAALDPQGIMNPGRFVC